MAASLPAIAARDEQPTFTLDEERDASFIDDLIQISEDHRTETLGPNYFDWVKEFFLFRPAFWQPQLEYQIKLRMPDLQTLVMQEASELTDVSPKWFVQRDGKRKKDREKAFQANWDANNFQLEWFKAELWALLAHTGYMEVYTDSTAPRSVRIRARDPRNVFADPFATDFQDWEYVVIRVPMAPDEIVRWFPSSAGRLPGLLAEHQRDMFLESRLGGVIGSGPMAIELPPGAMQSVAIGRPPGATDYLSVDFVYIKDDSRESVVREIEGSKNAGGVLPPPSSLMRYPTGRLIVRTGKLKLWDGQSQYRRFPIMPVFALPPIYGVQGTPPIQYLIQMQHLAESMHSQNAENMIRLNYGYRLYQDGAILNPDNMDKLGGSLRVKTTDDVGKSFKVIPPSPYSPHQQQYADQLLAHMARLFGFTPERQGSSGQGNISPGLMDTAVTNAQAITRMRARLLADSVQHVGRLVFETMVDWLDDSIFHSSFNGDFRLAPWQGVPLDQLEGWKIQLDADSMRPMSQSTLKQLVPVLLNLGAITKRDALSWLNVPGADDISDKLESEEQQKLLAAMATAGKGGKGGGKK
jgi:hypothetical protein